MVVSKKHKPKHRKPRHHKYKDNDEKKVNKPTCGKCGGLVVGIPYCEQGSHLFTKKCVDCGAMFL